MHLLAADLFLRLQSTSSSHELWGCITFIFISTGQTGVPGAASLGISKFKAGAKKCRWEDLQDMKDLQILKLALQLAVSWPINSILYFCAGLQEEKRGCDALLCSPCSLPLGQSATPTFLQCLLKCSGLTLYNLVSLKLDSQSNVLH